MAKPKDKPYREPKIAEVDDDGVVHLNANEGARAQNPANRRPELSALGSDLRALQERFAGDIIASLWFPKGITPERKAAMIDAALLMFARFDPRDEAEAMLCVQMIATHNAAMECHRRAVIPDQSFEGRDMALKHAAKMSALYERQLAAYDKRRGKRNQTVIVKHVTVEPGAQAIVGDVHTHGAAGTQGQVERPALEHRSDEAVDALPLRAETVKARRGDEEV